MESQTLATTEEWEQRLGHDVRRLRHRQRFTQAELAERANVSLSALKYLEGGRGSSLSTMVRVARALGRSDWLAGFAPAEPQISPMAMLHERRRAAEGGPRRVRHARGSRPGAR